jgi:hypothetical protein
MFDHVTFFSKFRYSKFEIAELLLDRTDVVRLTLSELLELLFFFSQRSSQHIYVPFNGRNLSLS